jgi:hypothetical protein
MKAVRHYALVRLPALVGHKVERRPGTLPTPEQQIEKLIDERIIGRERIAGKHSTGNALEKAALESRTDALNDQVVKPVRPTRRKLKRQDATE